MISKNFIQNNTHLVFVTMLIKKEQNKEKDNVIWALNQFRYKKKTEDERKAFLILERVFKKTPLR